MRVYDDGILLRLDPNECLNLGRVDGALVAIGANRFFFDTFRQVIGLPRPDTNLSQLSRV